MRILTVVVVFLTLVCFWFYWQISLELINITEIGGFSKLLHLFILLPFIFYLISNKFKAIRAIHLKIVLIVCLVISIGQVFYLYFNFKLSTDNYNKVQGVIEDIYGVTDGDVEYTVTYNVKNSSNKKIKLKNSDIQPGRLSKGMEIEILVKDGYFYHPVIYKVMGVKVESHIILVGSLINN